MCPYWTKIGDTGRYRPLICVGGDRPQLVAAPGARRRRSPKYGRIMTNIGILTDLRGFPNHFVPETVIV